MESVFIDTGENGIFSLEEFGAITTGEQMEFVTPEEIAYVVVREIKGGNTGHDVINALDNAVMGPTYRAGADAALGAREAARARDASTACTAWRSRTWAAPPLQAPLRGGPAAARLRHDGRGARGHACRAVARRRSELAGDRATPRIVSIGIPDPAPRRAAAARARSQDPRWRPGDSKITPERLEAWVVAGWVDLRRGTDPLGGPLPAHRRRDGAIPPTDTSSRFLRDPRFWRAEGLIQPGKIVGWIFGTEEQGARMK